MIKIKIGEQKPINYSIREKTTGLPVSLVGSTIIFQLKETENQLSDFLLEKIITEISDPYDTGLIYSPSEGRFSVFIKSEDTISLNINKDYYYTIWKIQGQNKEVISASGLKVEEFKVCPA
ncbi:MAG: hypothetical protein PHX18_00185 [Candidatus Gastranaerophilales bacterium]|nr:hypothetical protein [Candidatus Gastranaerophilales bacterium]